MMQMLKMTGYLSDKLKVLSFVSIVSVIYSHMYYTEVSGMTIMQSLQEFVGGSLGRIAVPLFYTISGYLYFLKTDNGLQSIYQKMKKRVRTLFVPYMIANTLTFIFYVLLNCCTRVSPTLDNIINFKILDSLASGNIFFVFKLIFWDPIAFQLWFLRDLMIFVLLSPVVYLWLRQTVKSNLKVGITLVLFAVAAYYNYHISWVIVGGLFAMSDKMSIIDYKYKGNKLVAISLMFLVLVLCVLNIMTSIPNISNVIPFIGVPAVWILYDVIVNGRLLCNRKLMSLLCKFTFFIYLVHEPLLNIFKKIPLLFGKNEINFIVSYLVTPWIFIAFALALGLFLKKYFNKIYSVYTGGR